MPGYCLVLTLIVYIHPEAGKVQKFSIQHNIYCTGGTANSGTVISARTNGRDVWFTTIRVKTSQYMILFSLFIQRFPEPHQICHSESTVVKTITWPPGFAPDETTMIRADIPVETVIMEGLHNAIHIQRTIL